MWVLHYCLYSYMRVSQTRFIVYQMNKLNFKVEQGKKDNHTTNSKHNKPVAQNLLENNLPMPKANQA